MGRKIANLIRGMSTVLSLFPPPQPKPTFGHSIVGRNDADALRGDWQKVGDDLRAAMGKCKQLENEL